MPSIDFSVSEAHAKSLERQMKDYYEAHNTPLENLIKDTLAKIPNILITIKGWLGL